MECNNSLLTFLFSLNFELKMIQPMPFNKCAEHPCKIILQSVNVCYNDHISVLVQPFRYVSPKIIPLQDMSYMNKSPAVINFKLTNFKITRYYFFASSNHWTVKNHVTSELQ